MAFIFNKSAAAAALASPASSPAAPPVAAAAHPLPPPGQPLAPVPQAASPAAQPPPAGAAAPPARRRGRPRASDVAAAPPAAAIPGQQTIIAPAAPPAPPAVATVLTPPLAVAAAPAAVVQALPMAQPAPSGIFALFAPPPGQPSALGTIIAIGDRSGGEDNIFPTAFMSGGQTGGAVDLDEMNVAGTDAELPVGRDPFSCVLFGYRLVSLLWPKAAGPVGGPKVTPRHRATIGSGRPDLVNLAFEAQRAYQFRVRPQVKGSPEPFYDTHGHPSLALEMLVFDGDAGVYAVRTASTYDSVLETSRAVNLAFPNGQVQPTPVIITPKSWQTKGSKAMPNGWPEHGFNVTQALDQELWTAFSGFVQHTQADQEFIDALTAWSTTDAGDVVLSELTVLAKGG